MEDDVLIAFWRFVKGCDPGKTSWAHGFVDTLVEEIIRLRVKYEGLILEDDCPLEDAKEPPISGIHFPPQER